jgi:ribosomal protein S18 acetylase RimI-like enzyme
MKYRQATSADVPAMAACRLSDPAAGRADERMAAYFQGTYSPGDVIPGSPRTGFVAFDGDEMVGYIAGHHTTRMHADAEIEYLFVAPSHRRRGVATELVRLQARWFVESGAINVIVNADPDSPGATELYLACGANVINRHWLRWNDITAVVSAPDSPRSAREAR